MRLATTVVKEISHRRLNFALAVLTVTVAAASFMVTTALLRGTDLETDSLISAKLQDTEKQMAKLEDEIRKSMKGLGFNIYIFPEGQNMSEVYDKGFASKTMPEAYVTKLANSQIVTVNHLLPTLTRKIEWAEKTRTILLIGVRGEVPIAHLSPKKPLIDPVQPGEIVLGYELHRGEGIKVGDQVTLMGREFKVAKCHSERGSRDDITAWISLRECQELLGMEGRINAILALECNCATVDRIGEIRKELGVILPGTKIIERESEALARAEARLSAKATAMNQVESMKEKRQMLQQKRSGMASVLLPLIATLCLSGVGVLTFLNVRERLGEIGILMAVGVKSGNVLNMFLLKALLVGVLGGLLGILVAAGVMNAAKTSWFAGYDASTLFSPFEMGIVLLLMPAFACIAAWLPAFWGAQQDPAMVLRND